MADKSDGSITIDTKLDNTGFTKGSEQLKQAVRSLTNQIDEIGDGLKNAVSFKDSIKSTKEYENAVTEFAKTCASFDEAKTLAEAAQIVEDLRNQLDAFANTQYHIDGNDIFGRDTEVWPQMSEAVSQLQEALINQGESSGRAIGESIGGALDGLLGKIRHVIPLFKTLKNTMGSAFKSIVSGAKKAAVNLAKMAKNSIVNGLKKLGSVITGIGKGSNRSGGFLGLNLKSLLGAGLLYRAVTSLFRNLKSAVSEGFENLSEYSTSLKSNIDGLKNSLTTLKNSFAAAFAPVAEIVLPILTRLINGLAEAVSKVGQLIAALTGKSSYLSVQTGAASSASSAAGAMDKESASAKKLQKTLAGFDDIEILQDKASDSGSGSGGGAGTVFQNTPIDSAFGNLADMLKEAWAKADFTEIGRMVSAKLKSALESIPWSQIKATLRNVARSIATFLNGFLEDPELFTVIGKTIAQGLNTAFATVDAFVSSFNWSNLGNAVKAGILGFLNNIDWRTIYRTMENLGKGLAEAFNSINDREVWSKIFTTLAKILNSLFIGVRNFFDGIEWEGLGKNIGDGLNDGIEEFEWENVSGTLKTIINGIFDTWYDFVTTFHFEEFGEHIGTTLSETINGIDWKEGGASVAETINGLFDALDGFVTKTEFASIGDAVIQAIVGFFSNLHWSDYAVTLSDVILGLQNALIGAMESPEIDWEQVPKNIVNAISDFLTNFKWDEVAKSTGELIATAFNTAVQLGTGVWTMLQDAGAKLIDGGADGIKEKLRNIGDWIKIHIIDKFIKGFKEKFDFESFKELGSSIWNAIKTGITSAASSLWSWLTTDVEDPFVEEAGVAFGLDGENTDLPDIGGGVIGKILDGMVGALSGIANWLKTNIVDPIVDGIKGFFGLSGEGSLTLITVGMDIIGGIKAGIASVMSDISNWVESIITSPFIENIKSFFKSGEGFPDFVEIGSGLIGGIQSGVEAAMDTLSKAGGWIEKNIGDPFIGAVKDIFGIEGDESTVGESIGRAFGGGVGRGFGDTETDTTDAVKGVKNSMMDVFGAVSEILSWAKLGSNLMSLGLKAGIMAMQPSTLFLVQGIESSLRGSFDSKVDSWRLAGANLMIYLQIGLKSQKDSIVNDFKVMLDAMKTEITNKSSEFKTAGETVIGFYKDGMTDKIERVPWSNLGRNIAVGIYNGLFNSSQWLATLAWNVAVNMYNSACRALGIHSPSKVFAHVGEMITEGLGEGVKDTQDNAVKAVTGMADAVTQEAENADPYMKINTSLSSLTDDIGRVLTSFSDTVVQNFDKMIAAMEDIVNGSSFAMPAAAAGSMIPYAANRSYTQGDEDELLNAVKSIAAGSSSRITRTDLAEVLAEAISRYLNIDFYIGDEQIARHANAGNLKLEYRYNPAS